MKDYNGHTFNGPNDLWINSNGCIYFTDPYFQRDYWKRTKPDAALSGEKLYFMKDETSAPVLADANVKKPNGVVGTPDGKFLFVADMGTNKTYRYQINKDGSLSNKEILLTSQQTVLHSTKKVISISPARVLLFITITALESHTSIFLKPGLPMFALEAGTRTYYL